MKELGYTKLYDGIVDTYLPHIKISELKCLIIILRQTVGWNKRRDRISHSQFMNKTGLSRRSVGEGIALLEQKALIRISDRKGNILKAQDRKHQKFIYYEVLNAKFAFKKPTRAKIAFKPMQNLHITIDTNNKQKKGDHKKQSDHDRIKHLLAQEQDISCTCVRCLL